MIDWWNNLEPESIKFFVLIGGLSTAVLLIQLVATFLGGSLDLDVDVDHGADVGVFSVRGIGAFFVGFGWTGAAVLEKGGGLMLAVILATVVGIVVLFGFYILMRWLHSFSEEGTLDYKNAIGQIGKVYLPIPPKREGFGQIEVLVQNRIMTVRAVTDHDEKIGNTTPVRVIELIDERSLLVEKI